MTNNTGAIMTQSHVANTDGNVFADQVAERIRSSERFGYYTEVQYQTTMQPNGTALFSALILSRKKEDAQ